MNETKYDELMAQALEEIRNNDDLFVDLVNDMDSWNGYADGFRGFPMNELNDLFYGCSLTDFLNKLGNHFDHTEAYFMDTIYGIVSTDDLAGEYRGNIDEDAFLDDIIEEYENGHISIYDSDFETLLDDIIEARDEDEDEDEDEETEV